MLRTSLAFVLVALCALAFADLGVSTFDPWGEFARMGLGMLTPDFLVLPTLWQALANTVSFALIGIGLAVVFGAVLSLFFNLAPVRYFCACIRAVHELFWAFLFMPVVGLGSLCGILAIAVPYAGVFAKVYAEIRQESDQRPTEALPPGSSRLVAVIYTTLPMIYGQLKNYTSYRFECGLRSAAILGFIGLPTLGYHLETSFREGRYSEAAALLYTLYLLIVSIRFWARPRLLLPLLACAIGVTSWQTSLSLANIVRFFSYDILPWPMRAEGYYAGTQTVVFSLNGLGAWLSDIMATAALPGLWQTMILSQIALVSCGLLTLLLFPFASRRFFSGPVTGVGQLLLVVLRTTPEYILAYLFLTLWGPSMLPAILALALHNSGILAYITARNVDLLELPFDGPPGRGNRYLYEVLPRCYGQLLAFLFYRWEVIMRESAILGILGIATLGHFVDNAIAGDHLDTAVVLIVFTAGVNIAIDSLSQRIRERLRISAHLSADG